MQVFDASSMIHAWDNYPVLQFPGLWEWIAEQIEGREIALPHVAFEEIEHKAPDCARWLDSKGITKMEINNEILQESMRIKTLLGIQNDNFHSKGVGENDIFIIASARTYRSGLVSDERRQQKLPEELKKCKIPAVCAIREVNVPCISFIGFIKNSGAVFH